jgi:hypothetical protein
VQKTSIGSGRVTVVAALARNAVGDDKADVPVGRLSSAAVDILLGLYTAQTRMLENGFRNDVANLAVCTLLANLIDGFVAAELGKPSLSLVQKGWHLRRRELLLARPNVESRKVGAAANRLTNDFRKSLEASAGANGLARELAAICLAVISEYHERGEPGSCFAEAEGALSQLIRAFSKGVA